jgi:hypothetical protein
MRGRRKGDEELRPVTVGPLVRHADNAAGVVSQRRADLVLEELVRRVEDGGRRLGLGVRGRAARLHHEVGDQAVEGAARVEARGAQREEVLGRLGDRLAEDFELDVTARRVQLAGRSVGRSSAAMPGDSQ